MAVDHRLPVPPALARLVRDIVLHCCLLIESRGESRPRAAIIIDIVIVMVMGGCIIVDAGSRWL